MCCLFDDIRAEYHLAKLFVIVLHNQPQAVPVDPENRILFQSSRSERTVRTASDGSLWQTSYLHHAAIFVHGFLTRDARRTKQKRDYS